MQNIVQGLWHARPGDKSKQEGLANAKVMRDSSACMKAPNEEI